MKAMLSEIIGSDTPIISESIIEVRDYRDYYKYLNCDLFTVVMTEFKGYSLSLFVDDEGLLKHNYGREVFGYPEPLFGNIVITGGVDCEGNTLPIPDGINLTDMVELISEIKYESRG